MLKKKISSLEDKENKKSLLVKLGDVKASLKQIKFYLKKQLQFCGLSLRNNNCIKYRLKSFTSLYQYHAFDIDINLNEGIVLISTGPPW